MVVPFWEFLNSLAVGFVVVDPPPSPPPPFFCANLVGSFRQLFCGRGSTRDHSLLSPPLLRVSGGFAAAIPTVMPPPPSCVRLLLHIFTAGLFLPADFSPSPAFLRRHSFAVKLRHPFPSPLWFFFACGKPGRRLKTFFR